MDIVVSIAIYCTEPFKGLHDICKLVDSAHGGFSIIVLNTDEIRSSRGIPAYISHQPISSIVHVNMAQPNGEALNKGD